MPRTWDDCCATHSGPRPSNTQVNTTMTTQTSSNSVFLSLNARSLYHKMGELSTRLSAMPQLPSIIAVCETWCVPSESDSHYKLDSYTIIRRDRPTRMGGGVLLYLHSLTPARRLNDLDSDNEDLWVDLSGPALGDLLVCSLYRPPDQPPAQFLANFEKSLKRAKQTYPNHNLLIVGDFNAKHRDWLASDHTDECGDGLQTLLDIYGLQQLVTFPTHEHAGQLRSCLDLVVTSDNMNGVSVTHEAPLGSSDHVVVRGLLPQSERVRRNIAPKHQVLCWSRADIAGLRSAVAEEPWADVRHCLDMEKAWLRWKAKLTLLVNQFIPRRWVTTRLQPRPWMTTELNHRDNAEHWTPKQRRCQRQAGEDPNAPPPPTTALFTD